MRRIGKFCALSAQVKPLTLSVPRTRRHLSTVCVMLQLAVCFLHHDEIEVYDLELVVPNRDAVPVAILVSDYTARRNPRAGDIRRVPGGGGPGASGGGSRGGWMCTPLDYVTKRRIYSKAWQCKAVPR